MLFECSVGRNTRDAPEKLLVIESRAWPNTGMTSWGNSTKLFGRVRALRLQTYIIHEKSTRSPYQKFPYAKRTAQCLPSFSYLET